MLHVDPRERRGYPVSTIYTKIGRPLRVSGDDLFSKSGQHVARLRGSKAYGPDGRYVGTLAGNRLVYRSTDSASIGSPFALVQDRPLDLGDPVCPPLGQLNVL